MKVSDVHIGTIGGTLCSIYINLSLADILHTVILASVGAGVSFIVSYLLAKWVKR
ncbi:hypothetical protein [Sphingobacterium sp. SYP-B4668]|uniref:hypothetical protein n=1 Tax=Sphingobacterium sp. SYP-B4668 TaxID=2996035 RepID=UPI0022DD1CF5|nr:hypothetical protein [Sphingobacterium sp. SYP-B4668]